MSGRHICTADLESAAALAVAAAGCSSRGRLIQLVAVAEALKDVDKCCEASGSQTGTGQEQTEV